MLNYNEKRSGRSMEGLYFFGILFLGLLASFGLIYWGFKVIFNSLSKLKG